MGKENTLTSVIVRGSFICQHRSYSELSAVALIALKEEDEEKKTTTTYKHTHVQKRSYANKYTFLRNQKKKKKIDWKFVRNIRLNWLIESEKRLVGLKIVGKRFCF